MNPSDFDKLTLEEKLIFSVWCRNFLGRILAEQARNREIMEAKQKLELEIENEN